MRPFSLDNAMPQDSMTRSDLVEELAARRIRGIVTQTGCAGHCKDEPTVEITLPGRRPVLYGHVTAERVAELVERQIVRGETAEGLIEA